MKKKRTTVWLDEQNVSIFSENFPFMLSRFINNCLDRAINNYDFCLDILFNGDIKK